MGADMIYNEYGFLIEPTSMEHAATQPRVEVIRTLLSHGARSNPGLTQQVSEADLSGILPMLKWAEDPELGPLYFKIKQLTEAGTPEPILPIISSLGPKAFEAILDECRIDPNTGEMEWSSLVDGNMNLLLNLILKCPEEAEVDPSIRVANIKKLHIWIQNDLTSLGEFTELEELEVSQASTLAGLSRLHGLKILKCTNPEFYRLFEKPESLSNLHSLEEIDLSANAQLNDLSGLGSLPNLKRLNLSRCNKLTDLRELTHLTGLEELDLSYIGDLEDATPLANLKNLKSLNLSHTSAAAGLDEVQALGIPDLKLPASIAPPAPTEAIHEDDQDEVFEKLVRITSEQLGISPDKITLGSRFIEDFGADSLDTVELTMAVEEEFEKEIPDAEAESIETFGQALAYLRENQNPLKIEFNMKTEPSSAAPFIDCVKVLRPEQRQLLLGLPHFITYLIAGVDGEIDHWELGLVLEAINETDEISPDFGACRESYQAEISPYLDRIHKTTKEKGQSLMYDLKWMITNLEKYQELMPLLPLDLQENIRRYVWRTGMAIAQASDDGKVEMTKTERGIGAAEYTHLTLLWDAFEITGDPDLPEVSPQGNQTQSVYSPNHKNTQIMNSLA